MLGAVTDTGDHFVALTPDSFTAKVSKHFLRALRHRFGKKLVIVLDNAPYFIANDLKKQAAADGLLLEYLPPYAPELNPLENCWLQLKATRKNRLFETIDDVKRFLTATIPRLTAPKVYHYLEGVIELLSHCDDRTSRIVSAFIVSDCNNEAKAQREEHLCSCVHAASGVRSPEAAVLD